MSDRIETSRRAFLGGLAAALAAPAIVPPSSLMPVRSIARFVLPTLWGDGEHDDAEALQAMLDGLDVRRPSGAIIPGSRAIFLPFGAFRVATPLERWRLPDKGAISVRVYSAEGSGP